MKEDNIKKELETTKALAEEYLNGWKRAKADLVNFQKETEKQKQEWIKFSTSSIVLTILPIYESIEKLTQSVEDSEIKKEYLEGIKNIKKQFDDLFKNLGIEKIKTIGERFDPNFHESVGLEESEQESGTIIQEIQGGYVMSGKVIRAAKVIVAE